MIQLSGATLQFGQRFLFDHISLNLDSQVKVGVVGRNGTGKTTLFKVISGLVPLDEGTVSIERGKTLAYLPQEVILASKKSVFDEAMSIFDIFLNLEKRVTYLEQELEKSPSDASLLIEEYSDCQERLAHFDKAAALARTHEILTGLGFSAEQKNQAVETLSVGWRMRVVLAQLLLKNADFYLFDEPTNHLDIVTQEWFLKFLKNARFGYLLITHDRHYLRNACDKILELSQAKATLYHGNFDVYERLKAERRAHQEAAYEQQQREIAQKERTIERFRASASKAKMAQSMIKQLDKIERIELKQEEAVVKLSFPPATRSGTIVLYAKGISHTFGNRTLFKNVSFEIKRGQKIALVAPNGVGKTTLFNLITEKISLQTGSIQYGHNVNPAYFEQDQARVLKPKNSVFKEVADACAQVPDTTIRAFLGSFLFRGDDIEKKIEVLSGGERNRVAMVKVLLQQANFLILDEPTNHLDLFTKDILLQALKQFDGTILIVSHDHAFIQELATAILELTPEGAYLYPGTYEEFLEDKERRTAQQSSSNAALVPEKNEKEVTQKDIFEMRKELRKIEQRIERLEGIRAKEAEKISAHEYGTPAYSKIMSSLIKIETDITDLTREWEQLLERIG